MVLAAAGVVAAAEGRLEVTVLAVGSSKAPSRRPLAGATVLLSHAAGLIDERSSSTDERGRTVFDGLPPSEDYLVEARAPGYGTVRREQVSVVARESTRLAIGLSAERRETVEVAGRGRVVHLDSGGQASTELSDAFIEDLPVLGRDYQGLLTIAPGVQDTDQDGNPNVHGARERDFKLLVDGISNVDPLTGEFLSFVNLDAIEELEIIDAGADASFGGAVGGYARVITKSGGNSFEGAFNLFFRDSTFDSDLGGGEPLEFGLVQPSLLASGPIVRDHLWFIASHEYIDFKQPIDVSSGVDFVQRRSGWRHFDKLTWQLGVRSRLQLQYSADPLAIEPDEVSSIVPPDSGRYYEQGGPTYSLRWTLPYSASLFLEATVAFSDVSREWRPFNPQAQNSCVKPRNEDEQYLAGLLCRDVERGGLRSGAYFQDYADERQRWTYKLDGEKFIESWLGGSHQLKAGLSLERGRYGRESAYRDQLFITALPLGSNVIDLTGGSLNTPALEVTQTVYSRKLDPNNPGLPALVSDEAQGDVWSLYVHDTYRPSDRFVVGVGLRVSREQLSGNGFVPFDPAAERRRYAEFLDLCMSGDLVVNGFPIVGARPATCFVSFGGLTHFTVDPLDIPQIDPNSGLSTGCSDKVNSWQCTAMETTLQNGLEVRPRQRERFSITNTNLAPRLFVSWDPAGDGKTKIAASWGRYFGATFLEPFVLENGPDVSFKVLTANKEGQLLRDASTIFSAFQISMVDRKLRSRFSDEWTISAEREIAPETSLRLRYVNRHYQDQLQDRDENHAPVYWDEVPELLADDREKSSCRQIGPYADCFGGRRRTAFGLPVNAPDGYPDLQIVSPFFGNVRVIGNFNSSTYEAYILELNRRFYQNWELRASYTWSRALGDAEDYSQVLGDYVTDIEDERGPLSNDQRNVVKVSGRVLVPWWGGMRLGGTISYQSGLPYSIVLERPVVDYPTNLGLGASGRDYNTPTRVYTFLLSLPRLRYPTGQRNDQVNPPYWNLDLNAQKTFSWRDVQTTVQLDMFNALGDITQRTLEVRGGSSSGIPVAERRLGRQFQLALRVNF
ncbi:MAG: TonB-dependent receptor [Acidobacteriota bacterium]|nr:MAG: TonB-dependent receptor [Acidobacteriota bacterium]